MFWAGSNAHRGSLAGWAKNSSVSVEVGTGCESQRL